MLGASRAAALVGAIWADGFCSAAAQYAPYPPPAYAAYAPAAAPSPSTETYQPMPPPAPPSQQTLKYEPWSAGSAASACTSRFVAPQAPTRATDLNGVQLQDVCIGGAGPHHIFVIGDWGGIMKAGRPVPADHRSILFPEHQRTFVFGADDRAQLNVAAQMQRRAPASNPDYVINVGDNFYWGGVRAQCGGAFVNDQTGQFAQVFEGVYTGPGLDGKQWLSVLGNHDFGGWAFNAGWDHAIGYTWASQRWMQPAMYYAVKVKYDDFSVDYYFTDSNVWDTFGAYSDPGHNICGQKHNGNQASCGVMGPADLNECPTWFKNLWSAQVRWLNAGLSSSTADWQVVVTHFPPEGAWGGGEWAQMATQHGIDLIISGHRHHQRVSPAGIGGTTFIVSGGGGGITSEGLPDASGNDDEYGFMDLTLSRSQIVVEAISHGGQTRSTTCIHPRQPGGGGGWAGPCQATSASVYT